MARLFNLARMNTATTGTGAITLGSAVSGFLSFAAAGVTNGQEVFYGIKDGSASEVGRGTYSSSGTQLTRTVIKSTNSDTAINLSGSAEVFITTVAEAFSEWGRAVDANGFSIGFDNNTGITDDSLNETLIFEKTASAVNYVALANSATAAGPTIAAKGDDTNIDLNLNPKGTGTLKSGGTVVPLKGTASDYRTGTATGSTPSIDEIWSAATEVTLTDAATITVNMSNFINAVVTLAGNRALGNPSNEKAGQSGVIRIVQDGTGSRTLSYGTDWEFAGGVAPTLSTAASSNDLLFYYVIATNRVYASLIKAVS